MIRDQRTYYVIKPRCILFRIEEEEEEEEEENGNRCYDTNYAPLAKKQRRIRNRRSSREVRALSRREYYFRLKLFFQPRTPTYIRIIVIFLSVSLIFTVI